MSSPQFRFFDQGEFSRRNGKPIGLRLCGCRHRLRRRDHQSPRPRFGPHAIRRASHMLCDGVHPLWNRSPVSVLTDVGDLALPNTSLTAMRETRRRFLFGLIFVGRLLDAKNESARLSFCHSRESGNDKMVAET